MIQFFAGMFLGSIAMGFAMLLYAEHERQKSSDMIDSAQDMEIGEGVTLSQGIRALFGDGSHWLSPEGDWVRVTAGMGRPTVSMYVYPKTGELELIGVNSKNFYADSEGLSTLIGLMVKAAKDRENAPQP